jgi:alcohol dehydrogenase YqhD (iron-dependent ADH family)
MSKEELAQKIQAARIKDGEHPRQFFKRLGLEYDLREGNLKEELTRQDKTDVKKMVKDELGKLLKKKDTKDEMGEIVKKIMKKLYKDLSLEHPYIIDRIKI